MKNERRGHVDEAILALVLGAICGSIVSGMISYGCGFDRGVIAHADGKAVVDTLSNGKRVVTKIEKNAS